MKFRYRRFPWILRCCFGEVCLYLGFTYKKVLDILKGLFVRDKSAFVHRKPAFEYP